MPKTNDQPVDTVALTVDITDWAQELADANPDLMDKEQAIATQMGRGFSPQQMGRMIVAGREVGKAERTLVPPTKLLIQTGAAVSWINALSHAKETFALDNGNEIDARRYVGIGMLKDMDPLDGTSWRPAEDPITLERSLSYLAQVVPGHIWSRLALVAVNGGDVQEAADALKANIDEMVARLV